MSAPLINLDNTPVQVNIWQHIGDDTRIRMSELIQIIRHNGQAAAADMQAEVRLWGSNAHALAAQEN